MILVTGAAASGKSALAERICASFGGSLLYVATMRPRDGEDGARIARHRAKREPLGFDTLECFRDLHAVRLSRRYDAALLECLGNLAANQMFDGGAAPATATADLLIKGVARLEAQVGRLVVVTNDVHRDGADYGEGTAAYQRCLARAGGALAARAEIVIESVCGLPLVWKGKLPL